MRAGEAAKALRATVLRTARKVVEQRAALERTHALGRQHETADDDDAGRIEDLRIDVEMNS